METTRDIEVQEFTEKEVIAAINSLNDKYVKVLGELKVSELVKMVNQNKVDECVNHYDAAIENYQLTANGIRLLADELMNPKKNKYESLDLLQKFNEMKELDKGHFLYEILKNDKNAYEILKASYIRIEEEAKKSPELNVLFEQMGLKNFLLNIISCANKNVNHSQK